MFMTYHVFARKWRPSKFLDVVGQVDVITAIKNSFNLNRIHHAYILSGTRGIGKTTIARLFAKGLNCDQGLTYNICGQCKNCLDIELGCFSDLIEIDAAYYTKVEDIRNFLDNVQYTPSRGKFKVYLIDEAHMLSKHSFNALLKILEEPPKHIKFILATTEYHKLPETIISRCLHFHLKPLSVSQLVVHILHICAIEKIKIDDNSAKLLANASQGSIRDALNLLEQAILLSNNNITFDIISNMLGILHIEQAVLLLENLINGNIDDLMHQIANYAELEVNWDALFKEILIILQRIAINQFSSTYFKKQIDNNNLIKQIESRICVLSKRITPEQIQLYYQIFLLSRRELPYAPNYRIGMEMAVLRALAFFPYNINSSGNQDSGITSSLNDIDKDVMKLQSVSRKINDSNSNNNYSMDNMKLSSGIFDNCNLHLSEKNRVDKNDCLNIESDVSNKSMKVIPNFTNKILNMRSDLIKNQQHFSKLNNVDMKSYSYITSKQISESILNKFSNMNLNIKNKNFNDDIIKKNTKKHY